MDQYSKRSKAPNASIKQKVLLTEYLIKYPQLRLGKFTNEFTVETAQGLWQQIAREINRCPGVMKTWRDWRKTWQDMYSKYRKKQKEQPDVIPVFVQYLSPAAQQMFGYTNVPNIQNEKSAEFANIELNDLENNEDICQATEEFVPLDISNDIDYEGLESDSSSEPDVAEKKRKHPSVDQKVKLMEFLAKHPPLVQGKFTSDFTVEDAQLLWQKVTRQLNSVPGGARKTWKEWRKTWHDFSKYKRGFNKRKPEIPHFVSLLSPAAIKVLGSKLSLPTHKITQETTEFAPSDSNCLDTFDNSMEADNIDDGLESADSVSEPGSPDEKKVFATTIEAKTDKSPKSRHSESCSENCSKLMKYEQRNLELKQEFFNFKKEYSRKKLEFIQEQTEALKSIARELEQRGISLPGGNSQ
ncbi:myb/SANT-like DNA-binding domain-containing protein [Phthorimaea operculella]|nr:myb/SANT-like DNA-binding domain-containing protein [Phthorimaea operculella]